MSSFDPLGISAPSADSSEPERDINGNPVSVPPQSFGSPGQPSWEKTALPAVPRQPSASPSAPPRPLGQTDRPPARPMPSLSPPARPVPAPPPPAVPTQPPMESVKYDLAGNPLPASPAAAAPPSPVFVTPATVPGGPAPFGAAPAWSAAAQQGQPGTGGKVGLYVGLGAAAVVLLALIFFVRASHPVLVPAPTSYGTYTALDKAFACDAPSGWTQRSFGVDGGDSSGVLFKKGTVRISVVSDLTGSLMGDVGNAGNANLPPEQQKPPVEKLHETGQKALADQIDDYDELPAKPLQTPMGDTRISEWTGKGGGMAGKLHGFRVTTLGQERRIRIVCLCPERDWAALQPAFLRIVNSLAPVRG